MIKNYNEETLKEIGIYELRALAKSLNVGKTSNKKRAELLPLILSALKTDLEDEDYYPTYLALFEENDMDCDVPYNKVASPGNYESHLVTGYVHKSRNGGFLIGTDLCTYKMTPAFMALHHLAQCDYIEVRAVHDEQSKTKVVLDVTQRLSSEHKRFDDMKGIKPTSTVELGGKKIQLGSRVLVLAQKTEPRYEHIVSLCKELDKSPVGGFKLEKLALIVNEGEYVADYLKENKIDHTYILTPDMSNRKQVASCLLALFTAKRLATEGSNAVLFIDNFSKLIRLYNNSITANTGKVATRETFITPGYTSGALDDLKEYFNTTKALDGEGSLTVIGYINNPEPGNEWSFSLYEEFSNLAKKILHVPNNDCS